jgi:hypothetical protein
MKLVAVLSCPKDAECAQKTGSHGGPMGAERVDSGFRMGEVLGLRTCLLRALQRNARGHLRPRANHFLTP